jgi:nucleotide-binding universal stress UspA family protein
LYRRILVPFDGSKGSWKAVRKSILLAREQGAALILLSVIEHLPHYAATVGEVEEEAARAEAFFARLQAEAVSLAGEQGVALQAETAAGHAAQVVVREAADREVDLIVIGHTGHGRVWGSLLGSTAARVVDHAHCDVLIVR